MGLMEVLSLESVDSTGTCMEGSILLCVLLCDLQEAIGVTKGFADGDRRII